MSAMQRGGPAGQRGGWAGRGGPMAGLSMPVEKARDPGATARRLLAYFRPHAPRLVLIVLAAAASSLFGIFAPRLLGNITTDLFDGFVAHRVGGGVDFHLVFRLVADLAALYVFGSAFSWVQQYLMAGLAQRVLYAVRRQVMDKFGRLPIAYFDAHPYGEILSRVVNDFDNISSTLSQSLTQFITSAITFVGVIVMMLSISWLMTVVIALTLPLSLLVTRVIARRSQRYFLQRQERLGILNGHVEEMYTGHVIIKAFGHERRAIDQFDAMNEALTDSTWKAQFMTGIIMPMMGVIGNIGYVLVSVIGGILVTRRVIQIGDIQAFILYARQFSMPITQLASISNSIQSALASTERVFEILDEPEEVAEPQAPAVLEAPRGEVTLRDVGFRYVADKPLMSDLTVHVPSGLTVAIVGPTGAGKTTLVNLLMRFYDVDAGAIEVDGVDIRAMRRADLRRMFGMVLQDTWLFSGTIRDNIAYGRDGATDEEVYAAARTAHADHFVRTLPLGYDTLLNEDASNLSEGQRQLLAIARAVLADPPILILDEATSSVDTRTEMAIQSAMRSLMRGRTSFVIAHRLSTVRDADLILVVSHGQVVEQGTQAQLLARDGLFAHLYRSQFAGQALETEAVG